MLNENDTAIRVSSEAGNIAAVMDDRDGRLSTRLWHNDRATNTTLQFRAQDGRLGLDARLEAVVDADSFAEKGTAIGRD